MTSNCSAIQEKKKECATQNGIDTTETKGSIAYST